jgi:N-acetylmuramic acid 6-phosphate etherase
MTRLGMVYENLMINLKPTNIKLRRRVISIVCEILSCGEEEAVRRLDAHNWSIREVVDHREEQ